VGLTMKRPFCLLLLLFALNSVSASQNVADSLQRQILGAPSDTNKLNLYNQLSQVYFRQAMYDSAVRYAKACTILANELLKDSKDSKVIYASFKAKALNYIVIGNANNIQGNYAGALKNYKASLKLREIIDDRKSIAGSLSGIGTIYGQLGDYPKALSNFLASLKIKEELNDKKGIADCYNNIGLVYDGQENYAEALHYHTAALKILQELDHKQGIANSLSSIGTVHAQLGNYTLSLENHRKALKIHQSLGNKPGIANTLISIGIPYMNQGINSEALSYFRDALLIYQEIGSPAGLTVTYINTGTVLMKQKKFKEAADYLSKARELAFSIGHLDFVKESYRTLADLDSAAGNYKSAYENYKLYIVYKDSLVNEEIRKKNIQSQMTFDFERKEAVASAEHKKELEKQQLLAYEKSRKQNIIITFIALILLTVLIFAVLVYRSLKLTAKQKDIIEKQKNLVEQQKYEVEQQKHLVEEKQKEIIDSINYARRIQSSLLPTEIYIDNSFKRLKK
jgi:tetratricopeptide (TPR) repeat protein